MQSATSKYNYTVHSKMGHMGINVAQFCLICTIFAFGTHDPLPTYVNSQIHNRYKLGHKTESS